MKILYILYVFLCVFGYYESHCKTNNNNLVDNIVEIKDFKKLLRTKTNVLVCFYNSLKQTQNILKVLKEAANIIKGQGTMVTIHCGGDARKLCKKLKVNPESYILKHYKDGEFTKDYDRQETVPSMVNFMRDPLGDIPWEEDISAKNVVHIPDAQILAKFIRKETKPVMIMFYAPWCGFCKSLKPEYAAAADELLGQAVLAAIDVNRPENSVIKTQYNITGFPTLLYYEGGLKKYTYEGDNNKNAIVNFLKNPQSPQIKVKEPEWSDIDSEVVHLTTSSFYPVIKEENAVLIMFYAPWCGHCKKMKPEYEQAAAIMKSEGIPGMLAALDATKEQTIASKYSVKGYPTLKFFSHGEEKFTLNIREASKIVDFMRNPKEPPPPPVPEKPWSEELSDVVHLTEETFKTFLKKKKHVLVMFYAPWCGHCKKAKPEFTRAASIFKDDPKVEFAAVDCTTQNSLCSANNVRGYPTIKYFNYYKTVKNYNGGRTEEEFVLFMKDPNKSIPESITQPSEINEGNEKIIHLTDNTYKSVISSKGPFLIMFHAPWCTHCKAMKGEYKRAAEELIAEGYNSRFAMVDCTENQEIADEFAIAAFPTLKLFKNGKFVKDYKGKRTKDDFKKFMIEAETQKDEL